MAPRLLSLAALAAVGAARMASADTVSCGGHFANTCGECDQGNGPAWCNGDCMWMANKCVSPGLLADPFAGLATGWLQSKGYSYSASVLVLGTIMFVYACFYNSKVIRGPPALPKVWSLGSPAKRGIFDCLWHPDTCMHTFFCMPVVAAKNYYAADVCPFWPGCILTFIGTYSPLYPITACFRGYLSGKVQDKLGVKHNCCMDYIYAAFCFPCDVGRESLEVDAEIGADITCCCNVKLTPRLVAEVENIAEKSQRSCEKYRICGGQGH